jgi:hypothetical protein
MLYRWFSGQHEVDAACDDYPKPVSSAADRLQLPFIRLSFIALQQVKQGTIAQTQSIMVRQMEY